MKFGYLLLFFFGCIIGKFIYDEIKNTIAKKKIQKDKESLVEILNDVCQEMENSKLVQIDENTFMLGRAKIEVTNFENVEQVKKFLGEK